MPARKPPEADKPNAMNGHINTQATQPTNPIQNPITTTILIILSSGVSNLLKSFSSSSLNSHSGLFLGSPIRLRSKFFVWKFLAYHPLCQKRHLVYCIKLSHIVSTCELSYRIVFWRKSNHKLTFRWHFRCQFFITESLSKHAFGYLRHILHSGFLPCVMPSHSLIYIPLKVFL